MIFAARFITTKSSACIHILHASYDFQIHSCSGSIPPQSALLADASLYARIIFTLHIAHKLAQQRFRTKCTTNFWHRMHKMETTDFNQESQAFLAWFKSLDGAFFNPNIEIRDLRNQHAGRGIGASCNPGSCIHDMWNMADCDLM
jgi:hypothetical protein